MDAVEYWQRQAREMTKEYELVLQSQRNEIETLQRRCGELMYENQMMKASTAADIRHFILNYQANATQLKHSNANKTASSSFSSTSSSSSSSAFITGNDRKDSRVIESRQLSAKMYPDYIPIALLLQYLHDYSNGLVSGPENKRKRSRTSNSFIESPRSLSINTNPSNTNSNNNNCCKSSPPNSPFNTFHNRRLYQRMLTRCFRHRPRESDLELMSEDDEESEYLQTQLRHKESVNVNVNANVNTNSEHGAFTQAQSTDEIHNGSTPQFPQPFSVAPSRNNNNDSSKTWCIGNSNSKSVNKVVPEQKISLFKPFQPEYVIN